jgi:flavodoxin
MKSLVVYYSRSGNNTYLAKRIAQETKADIEILKPGIGFFPVVMLLSMLKSGTGIHALKNDIKQYDQIIMCGPIWAGSLCSPLLDFIKKYKGQVNRFYFATSCGSDDKQKDDKFGYASVFKQVKAAAGEKCVHCEAFPVTLALPEDKRSDGNEVMKTKLSDANFIGDLKERLDRFVKKVLEA